MPELERVARSISLYTDQIESATGAATRTGLPGAEDAIGCTSIRGYKV